MREGKVNLHAPSLFLHDFPLNVTQEAKFVFHRLFFFNSTVIKKDPFQRPNGIEVIELDGDGTMLSVPIESDHVMNSLTSHKNEVRFCFC